MEKETFVLRRSTSRRVTMPVRIYAPTWESLSHIRRQSGVPITRIIEQMVSFCADRLEIARPEDAL